MESLEQFFNDNDRGYPRDPRRMAYAKLKKNIQGMDREQLEAFIKANLFIPHSQYKMALGNLIQFLNKQDQMGSLNEVKRFRKIAGLLKEDDYSEDPSSDMDDESQSGDTDAMDINETEDVKKRQLYARYVNGFINQNQDDLGQIYDEQGYLAALKMVRDKIAAILHRAGEYEYPTAKSGIGDSFPLVDAIHRIFKQIGFKKAHKGV